MSFATHYGFQVDTTSGRVKYYDAFTGEVLDLRRWRKTVIKNYAFRVKEK